MQRVHISQYILKMKNKTRGLILPYLKICHKATNQDRVLLHKERYIEQWIRIENPQTYTQSQLIFNKSIKR